MKTPLAISAAMLAATLFGDTWTWTGNVDDKWEKPGNWAYTDNDENVVDPATTSPGANWSGTVVISGDYRVVYDSGDLAFNGTLEISGGATFYQDAISWPNFSDGTVTVENGLFDLSRATGATAVGTIVLNEGGAVNGVDLSNAKSVVVNSGGEALVSSNIDSSKLTLNDGAKFVATAGDFQVPSDTRFGAVDITAYTITTGTDNPDGSRAKISLDGTKLKTTRTGAVCGIWDARYAGEINFLSGSDSSFTFPSSVDGNAVTDKASAYQYLFQTGYFHFDGAPVAVDSSTWLDHFEVYSDGDFTTVSYVDVLSANRLGELSVVSATSSSATLAAEIAEIESGAVVKFAYGINVPDEAQVLAGDEAVVSDWTATAQLTGLAEDTVYNYAFAIVTNGAVAAFKTSSFVASDYDYVYMNGAWIGGSAPTWSSNSRVLVTGSFETGEIDPENKKFKDAIVHLVTIANGNGPLTVCNSSVLNDRSANLVTQVPYGIWNNSNPINFTSASGDGFFFRADSYTCYVTEDQYEHIYSDFIGNGRITVAGETIGADEFAASFTTDIVPTELQIEDGGENYNLSRATVTLWEKFPADASGVWTVKKGARIRLDRNVKISGLVVESEEDTVIDLNGYKLKAGKMSVAGVKVKGDFTSDDLPILAGEGSLEAGKTGLVIKFR